ncbi:ATP-binding protein [Alteromonas oceani]|uniref:histidine kinase n=1 Tax=Alteromonas oceani TaxID=2071609 RepID=A0ABV7K2G8_9ALTE|nr:ATP-binding protein [Alteromonas oceani]
MDSRFSFSLYAAVTTIVSLLIGFTGNQQIVTSYNENLLTDLQINLKEAEVHLSNEFASYREDIGFLYTTPPISGLTRSSVTGVDPLDGTTTALWKSQLEKIFMGFMQHNRAYFQLRILDNQGQELIRVERLDNLITARASNDLQDKSDRYYFTETSKLSEEQLFVSIIDLNRENGKLSFPYRPTLRLARPIYGEDNAFFGILIANIDVSYLIAELDLLVTNKYDLLLTDVEGFFIKHPDSKLRYSRDLAPSLEFSSYYKVTPTSLSNLLHYSTTDQLYWGIDDELTVSGYSQGSELHPYILFPDDIYQDELNNIRLQFFLALTGIWAAALFGLFFLSNNNKRLSNLLKVAEEAQSAVNVADDAIITVNEYGNINTVNNAFENIFLVHRNECLGESVSDVFSRFGCEVFKNSFETGKVNALQNFEWQLVRQGVPGKWLKTKIQPVENSKSEAAFAIVTCDITAEKQATSEIEKNNQQLEATVNERTLELKSAMDKALEVSVLKSNFISTISHEMRTPLNGIVGAVSLLKNQPLNAQQIELTQMAENSVDALRRLINDVLDLSKIEAGKLELQHRHFNAEALIESIASTMSVVAHEKSLDFYIDTVDLELSMINSDPHRLTQVLTNLLNNAIKFTDGGFILLKAWSAVANGNACLHIDITDTGTGIAAQNLDKLFKPFSQADEGISAKYGGTGLGLSICKQILDLLGGMITVESTEGKGSTFHVELPVDLWEEKSLEGKERLSGQTMGILVNKSPLNSLVERLVNSHGGDSLIMSNYQNEDEWAQLSMLVVNQSREDFNKIKAMFKSVVSKLGRGIKFIVISAMPINKDDLPEGSVNLIEPLYRSSFLSSLLDSRQKTWSSPLDSETYVERRSTDIHSSDKTEPPRLLNCRALVVDDNEINTQVARFILEPHNVKVAVVENGKKAIKHLANSKETYNVVLMDCNMPVMNGYDATRAIRAGRAGEHYKDIPIIAMTANAMKGENEKCRAAGMDDYITKPVEPSLLIRKLSQHIDTAVSTTDEPKPAKADDVVMDENESATVPLWKKDDALIRLGGREPLLAQLLSLFVKGAEQKFEAIQDALSAQDREKLRFSAHALKGNSGDVGAEALHKTLAELEQQAPDAPFDTLKLLVESAQTLLNETLQIFDDYLRSQG